MNRVLVIDADPDWRFVVRLALAGAYEVVGELGAAAEAPGAAAALEQKGRSPELVLLGVSRPEAFSALPGLREALPNARVVLVSSHGRADLARASRACGALGYLNKELPARRMADELSALDGLLSAVEAALASSFAPDPTSARAARRFVEDALGRLDRDDLAEVVTLLVSELVTNAVIHAGSEVEVLVRLLPDGARIEVSDASAQPVDPRDATTSDTSGRGLALVETLARSWGTDPRAGGGKTVWFEVERPS